MEYVDSLERPRVHFITRMSCASHAEFAPPQWPPRILPAYSQYMRQASSRTSDSPAPATLTPKEFDILRTLADNPQRLFSREALLEQVWGAKHASHLRPQTVDRHVAKLVEKLGPVGPRLITAKTEGFALGKG